MHNANNHLHVGKRYLNSGAYIGYAKDLYQIISKILYDFEIKSHEDDQKYFHWIYINEDMRNKHKIKLDHESKLFFNIYGSAEEVEFHCKDNNLK